MSKRTNMAVFVNVFYSLRDVAKILGVSLNTVYALTRGAQPALRTIEISPHNHRVYGGDLLEYLRVTDRPVQFHPGKPGLFANVFYKVGEAARILGVHPRTLYKMVSDADSGLRSRRLGPGGHKGIRIYGAWLADYLGIPAEMVPNAPDKEGEE